MQVPSERDIREIVEQAIRRADEAHKSSEAARARLAVIMVNADEAVARISALLDRTPAE